MIKKAKKVCRLKKTHYLYGAEKVLSDFKVLGLSFRSSVIWRAA
jgi:hypothetical protein